MRIKKSVYWLGVLLLVSCFFSCKKYLDVKMDKTLVVPSTIQDLQGLLDDNHHMNVKTPAFNESSADDYFMTPETLGYGGEFEFETYTWQVKEQGHPNDWSTAYFVVFNANYCLEQLEGNAKTFANEQSWNNVKGSAHFFRGYIYLLLLWQHAKAYDPATADADLGITLRKNSDFNAPSVRASVNDCYKQIISDLTIAGQYLPIEPMHPMRPSLPAVYGALARCYLSMNKYDSAFKYADLCLSMKPDLLDYNSSEVNPVAMAPFKPFNKEVIFYSEQAPGYANRQTFLSYHDTLLYRSYAEDDLRKAVFYFENGAYHGFKGHYSGDQYRFFSGIGSSEIYLMRAESYARMGRTMESMNDLNRVLEHRWKTGTFIPLIAETPSEALDMILVERRKELTMRGLRWMDIKRLNKLGANISLKRVIEGQEYILPANDKRFALPIPDDIIRITGMPQN